VVAYRAADPLDRCLTGLAHATPVTVVDNSSSSEIRDVAGRHRAEYIDPGANVGFAAGVNRALRPAVNGVPNDVLLLNPDARLTPDALGSLANFLHKPGNGQIGCVAPRLLDANEQEQRVVWPFPSPRGMWIEALGAGRLRSHPDFVIGAVLLLRWEALRDVGSFDERFFLYGEETDWQRRAAGLGWCAAQCPDVIAVHDGAGSSDDPSRRELLFHAAQETYIRKWHGSAGWWSYRVAAVAGATVRAAMSRGERRTEAARRARVYARGPRRSAGLAWD
jgi:GT2 family glycosyltransferase